MTVTRRRFLNGSAVLAGAIGLAGMLKSRRAEAKIAPNLVGYQDTPKDGRDCAGCQLFEPPNACKSVDGTISPNGWCKLWLKKA
jgi:hypothetical protein